MTYQLREAILDSEKEAVRTFLAGFGLRYDADIDYTASLLVGGKIIATASTAGNIIKAVAVSPAWRGENLTGRLVSHLLSRFRERGIHHCNVFTKTENIPVFTSLNFRLLAKTEVTALLESKNGGIEEELSALKKAYNVPEGPAAALVVNCNPFTLGHRYLIEWAAARHRTVLVFVVETDRSYFPFSDRFELVKAGTADLQNVIVLPSTSYVVSSFTFPDYFLKEVTAATDEQARLDAQIFKEYFVPAFNIEKRYLGSETDPVTLKYNQALLECLNDAVTVVPRLENDREAISASRVRQLHERRDFTALAKLVPETTLSYLRQR